MLRQPLSEYKSVVILSGAGVSTNAGIPDFRSPDGLYDTIARQEPSLAEDPEFIFHKNYTNRQMQEKYLQPLEAKIRDAQPTASHILAVRLWEAGKLKRVITQNGDGLYQKAGLPSEFVCEFHRADDGSGVMFGQDIGHKVIRQVYQDFGTRGRDIDLVLVMGTSLQVAPFCAVPNLASPHAERVLVDLRPEVAMRNNFEKGNAKFGKRRVWLRAQWQNGRWPHDHVHAMDCDDFSRQILATL